MMRKGHNAAAMPVAITTSWVDAIAGMAGIVTLGMAGLILGSCMLPDLDHPAKKGPAAWVVQRVAWRVWMLTKTDQDKIKDTGDTHRDFTHTIEGAAMFGGALSALTYPIPGVGAYWFYWGLAVWIGCVSHILADSMTPSGVPFSMTLNRLLGHGTWQRWCLGWRTWHKLPIISVIRIENRRKIGEHRGFFHTNSAGEKLLMVPLLYAASAVLLLAITGMLIPLINLVTGLWS